MISAKNMIKRFVALGACAAALAVDGTPRHPMGPAQYDQAVSRSITVVNVAVLPEYMEAVSRSITVMNAAPSITYTEAISRALTVINMANNPVYAEAISRSLTVCNAAGAGDDDNDGVPDCDDLCPGFDDHLDCDKDGIPDGCEEDCNGNSVPDDCEVADCAPQNPNYPGCDDCNLNGVLDACDISSGVSMDADGDGVPDECVDFVAGCAPKSNAWSCPNNWELGDQYPDIEMFAGPFFVTLDGSNLVGTEADDVFLDVDAVINSLRILEGAELRVAQVGDQGDLRIVDAGELLVEGDPRESLSSLVVAGDRRIEATNGVVTIGEGGSFRADPDDPGFVSATLLAGNFAIHEGVCGAQGTATLTQAMVVLVGGTLLLDGGGDGPHDPGCCPPDLTVSDSAQIEAATVFLNGPVAVEYTSAEPLDLSGDFVNHSQAPESFNWIAGAIRFDGNAPQSFEVAGRDLGCSTSGFANNFGMGRVELKDGAQLIFADRFDNDGAGQEPCSEALYVHELVLGPNSVLEVENVRIYYEALIERGGMVIVPECSCGGLRSITQCTAIASSDPPCGAIDARQPHDFDGSNTDGWQAVDLIMNGDLASVASSDFAISHHGAKGEPPAVVGITLIDKATIRLELTGPVAPGAWTTITHLPSRTSTRLGYLPADVNGDGTSGPLDILALIDGLNGVSVRPLENWQCDINRSVTCGPQDILREIDLLNGAGAFEPWNGRSLPP